MTESGIVTVAEYGDQTVISTCNTRARNTASLGDALLTAVRIMCRPRVVVKCSHTFTPHYNYQTGPVVPASLNNSGLLLGRSEVSKSLR